ncbi:hypothetical protein PIB30_078918 [Stylosanthes scabra]|uniref:Uncharacterized protein n=1 Tax=Stylosanthes scabra TaxID=79078 RepID=A0ABU6TQK3_9FABA|nr:hypothetical protein [Stylosanthes scabra]
MPKAWQCVCIGSGFGLQAFLYDLLIPRVHFSHFRSELCLLKPETLERTHQGIVRNGKQFKTQFLGIEKRMEKAKEGIGSKGFMKKGQN